MKKLLSAAMALVMGLSMGAPVLAVEGRDDLIPIKENKIEVHKSIDLTNEETVHPEETFTFKVGDGEVEVPGPVDERTPEVPVLEEFTIKVEQGEGTSTTQIDLSKFTELGVYTYKIDEVVGDTAGMNYAAKDYKLQVTVRNDGTYVTLVDENDKKTDTFQNDFSAGELVVKKEITGNFSQSDDTFEVTVTLTPDEGKNLKEGPITVTGAVGDAGSVVKDNDGVVTVTFTVTNDSTVTIANVPYDVSYVVTENAGDYTATITGDKGQIDEASQEVGIVNNLDQEIATGVNLDNLPYILVLALVGVGLISFTVRKRVRN